MAWWRIKLSYTNCSSYYKDDMILHVSSKKKYASNWELFLEHSFTYFFPTEIMSSLWKEHSMCYWSWILQKEREILLQWWPSWLLEQFHWTTACGRKPLISTGPKDPPCQSNSKAISISKLCQTVHYNQKDIQTVKKPWKDAQHHTVLLLLLLLSRFSRVRLCATPYTAAHQAPPSLGFSRPEHWSGLPFPSPMHESEKWKWNRSVLSNLATPRTAAYQAPPSTGFSRQEDWSGMPLPSL